MKITSHFFSISRSAPRGGFARTTSRLALRVALVLPISSLLAQPGEYTGRQVSGGLEFVATVNVGEVAKTAPPAANSPRGPELNPNRLPELRPPIEKSGPVIHRVPSTPRAQAGASATALAFRGFNGLTHLDQRNARGGNQFSLEPPDQGLAVGNGFILEAVNSAINVYDTGGVQRLPRPLALSEFFGLPAAIDRTTGVFGVLPFDPVALFDPETNRWFVVAIANLNKPNGAPLAKSRLYLGVSQTSDPTGVYKIYTLNTTFTGDPDGLGARFPDFPHIGFDRYGFFISVNEFSLRSQGFIGVAIFAISKNKLVTAGGSGGANPGVVRFALPFDTRYEFTVWPAHTPPGVTPFLDEGGAEFFVSGRFGRGTESSLSVWALTNTSSLDTASPSLELKRKRVDTQPYHFRSEEVEQREGFRPLGMSLNPNGALPKIDAGDYRVLSVVYVGGHLWATLGTEVTDVNGDQQMAAAYFALSPRIVNGTLRADLVTQGVVAETGVNLLRPAIAINSEGKGAMVFTLVGLHDYPSSAFVPIDGITIGPIQISRAGRLPEDGFTGYPPIGGGDGTARWGDYSAAGVDSDGSIWMATEYITDLPRTINANWDTYITRFRP